MKQACPLCRRRRARRACPALGQQICPVCCGTKRLVEINCPADCSYLRSAHAYPPAVVQRQQEQDVRFLLPLVHDLSEPQHRIMFQLQAFLRADRPDAPVESSHISEGFRCDSRVVRLNQACPGAGSDC